MKDETGKRRRIEEKVCEDMLSALPEDLLVQILLLVPINDAMTTAMLSTRWRSVWKMLPRLEYIGGYNRSSVWSFLEKSLLQLSKAPALEELSIRIGASCPVNVDVGKLVDSIVERRIQKLCFSLHWSEKATSLSKSLYTCKTLKKLKLTNKILVDVPSKASLPLLIELELLFVVYKDEDSLVTLFSSCPRLQNLFVNRMHNDNVTKFSVKVSSLQILKYRHHPHDNIGGSLVIDSPGLKSLDITDSSKDACLIEIMPRCLDMAKVCIGSHPNAKFLTSLSSVMYLNFILKDAADAICSVNFSRLTECKLTECYSVESIMHLLHNAPKLKVLMINSSHIRETKDLPLWSCVPGCLSSHLEIFEWEEYLGTRDDRKLLTYILANSKCLKTARISLYYNPYSVWSMKELESMHRVSESSQLIFSTQFRWRSMIQHPAYQVMSPF